MCAPQKDKLVKRTPEEAEEFAFILKHILPYIYLSARVICLYDRAHGQRFWPCVESWIATKTATENGLEASLISKLRIQVYGIQSCEGQDDEMTENILNAWHKTSTEEAIASGIAAPAASSEATPEAPAADEGAADKMSYLASMGFTDQERNAALLKKYGGRLERVVEALCSA